MNESLIGKTFQKTSSRLTVFVLAGAMLVILSPMMDGKQMLGPLVGLK